MWQDSDTNILSKESNKASQKLMGGADYMREIGSLPDRTQNHTIPSLGSVKMYVFIYVYINLFNVGQKFTWTIRNKYATVTINLQCWSKPTKKINDNNNNNNRQKKLMIIIIIIIITIMIIVINK